MLKAPGARQPPAEANRKRHSRHSPRPRPGDSNYDCDYYGFVHRLDAFVAPLPVCANEEFVATGY